MARDLSDDLKEKLHSVNADEYPLVMLEIDHADLPSPVRVVNDTQNVTHNGDLFQALAFRVTLPDDLKEGLSKARLSIDNIGKELMDWLELSGGGEGATCRIIQILRSNPDLVEWETTLNLNNVGATTTEVTGQLGYEDLLNRPGMPTTYRPDNAPGLF